MSTTAPGQLLAGRYRLLARLGAGGMGTVWKAEDERLRTDVALKEVLLPGDCTPGERAERITRAKREGLHTARLRQHPGIVTVHDVFEDDGLPWIVMELVDPAVSLLDRLRAAGPLPPTEVARIGAAVAEALAFAHAEGVVHRDIKPSNILLTGSRVLLTDFGIAAHRDDSTLTRTGVVGTLAYIAPERLGGSRDTSPGGHGDVFSLGVTLYQAVEGTLPFPNKDPAAMLAGILFHPPRPPVRAGSLAPVLDALLAKEPGQRPDAGSARRFLAEAAEGRILPPSAYQPLQAAPPTRHLLPSGKPSPPSSSPGRASRPPTPPAPAPLGPSATRLVPARRTILLVVLTLLALVGVAVAAPGFLDTADPGGDNATTPAGSDPTRAEAARFPAGSTMARLHDAGTITMGTKFDQPLFGLRNPAGELEGFDVEIAKIIAGALGIPASGVKFVETPSVNREAFIKQGRVDIVVATYTINDTRKQEVDFAGPYYVAGQQVMVRADEEDIIGPATLAGKKVCSVEGSTPAENIRGLAPDADLVLFDVYSKCAEALKNRQVDAVTTDNVVLYGLMFRDPGAFKLTSQPFTAEPYGIGLRKGDQTFRDFINDTLEAAFTDGRWNIAFTTTVGKVERWVPDPPAVDRYTS